MKISSKIAAATSIVLLLTCAVISNPAFSGPKLMEAFCDGTIYPKATGQSSSGKDWSRGDFNGDGKN